MSGAYFPCRMSILTAVYLNTDHQLFKRNPKINGPAPTFSAWIIPHVRNIRKGIRDNAWRTQVRLQISFCLYANKHVRDPDIGSQHFWAILKSHVFLLILIFRVQMRPMICWEVFATRETVFWPIYGIWVSYRVEPFLSSHSFSGSSFLSLTSNSISSQSHFIEFILEINRF